MRIARVVGTVTATVKDVALQSRKLMIVDIQDAKGIVLESSVVAIDACGAGPGDHCLLVQGSAARLVADSTGKPIDAALIAVLDNINC